MKNLTNLLWLSAFVVPFAHAQVTVEKPHARATAPGAKVGAGYMSIHNKGDADRLVGASSPASARVELHIMVRDGDVMRMREVPAFEVPAKGRLELAPGGNHLMFMNLRAPFKEGDRVPVTLRFERAGEIQVELPVGPMAGAGHGGEDKRHRH